MLESETLCLLVAVEWFTVVLVSGHLLQILVVQAVTKNRCCS